MLVTLTYSADHRGQEVQGGVIDVYIPRRAGVPGPDACCVSKWFLLWLGLVLWSAAALFHSLARFPSFPPLLLWFEVQHFLPDKILFVLCGQAGSVA